MINVIIPMYNGKSTIERTLASLVAQTDQNFEVIIIDDASTDDYNEILNNYQNKLKIIYIKNKQNLGVGMSRQVGIDNATQNFVTFLDSDDVFMPYTIECFNSIIAEKPEVELVFSHFYQEIYLEDTDEKTLALRDNNYTATHGKLYNINALKKYNIKNSPEIIWAEDAYFNSMCGGLFTHFYELKIPTMLWIYNKNSVLHKIDSNRDQNRILDFFNAMEKSYLFVLKNNGRIHFFQNVLDTYLHSKNLNDKEKEKLLELYKYIKE